MEIELKDVLKDLYNISGFRVSVHDLEFREIACYPEPVNLSFALVFRKIRLESSFA